MADLREATSEFTAPIPHTPGPWVIIPATPYDGDEDDLDGSYTSPAGIEGADGNAVCVFGTSEGSGQLFENEADYALIAAAPDMLEALLATDDAQDATDAAVEHFERAVAEGWHHDPTGQGHLGESDRAADRAWERAHTLRRAAIAKARGQ